MKRHADLTQRAVEHSPQLPWLPSPSPGVERKPLDRDGGEVARATTIVRYAPGSAFATHVHGGGEEFLVLDGVLTDEHGDYPAGTYVRNPIDSRHTPSSASGCVIFVKLRQMTDPAEPRVVMDTHRVDWHRHEPLPIETCTLFHNPNTGEHVGLERWPANTTLPPRTFEQGAELFVLEGQFSDARDTFERGSWLRLPAHAMLHATIRAETRLWIKTGHLADAAGKPSRSATLTR